MFQRQRAFTQWQLVYRVWPVVGLINNNIINDRKDLFYLWTLADVEMNEEPAVIIRIHYFVLRVILFLRIPVCLENTTPTPEL